MADLFTPNTPTPNSPVVSAVVRNNFAALYDKIQTLEPRATTPNSTALLIAGGPVYFRSNTTTQLRLINFNTTLIDLSKVQGYRTVRNLDKTLSREPLQTTGVSPWSQVGLSRELLISINSQGRLVFTEGNTITTQLSSPHDIYFDDSEIPICLVFIHQSGSPLSGYGQLQPIQQSDITDIRPFITTAFQNNQSVADLQQMISDAISRLAATEPSAKKTSGLSVALPTGVRMTTTNTKIDILSGEGGINNTFFQFPGVTIDLTPSSPLPSGYFNKAVIGLQLQNSIPTPIVIHGTSADAKANHFDVKIPSIISSTGSEVIATYDSKPFLPLAIVTYRLEGASGTTTAIRPITSTTFVDSYRVNYEFDILSIDSSTTLTVGIPQDLISSYSSLFLKDGYVDLYDNTTRPFRRQLAATSVYADGKMTITVGEPLNELFIYRNPKVRDLAFTSRPAIEDIRPTVFIGFS